MSIVKNLDAAGSLVLDIGCQGPTPTAGRVSVG